MLTTKPATMRQSNFFLNQDS